MRARKEFLIISHRGHASRMFHKPFEYSNSGIKLNGYMTSVEACTRLIVIMIFARFCDFQAVSSVIFMQAE